MTDEQRMEKENEIAKKLEGAWMNFKTNYLWTFGEDIKDNGRILIVADDKTPTPGTWMPHYTITYVDDENIFVDLWLPNGISQHRIKFLADNLLELQNPPFDSVDNVQTASVTLNRV